MDLNMTFGTDAGVYPHGDNARELQARVELGQLPADAVRVATLDSARALGLDDRGEVAAGKLADLIAVPGNPAENVVVLQNVAFVMKAGSIYKQP
jgi:imidazolonepropionase-like amidohydrolase